MKSRKSIILKQVAEYFIEKGKVLTRNEYAKDPKAPVRFQVLRRYVPVWSRIDKIIQSSFPELYAQIGKPVEEPAKPVAPKPAVKKPATSKTVKANEK